jgi:hypothetical protein
MLDTLLIVRGETASRFSLGIGIDVAHPIQEAMALMADTLVFDQQAPPPKAADSGWLFHLDAKNVIATHWSPLVEDRTVVGFRTRLLETFDRPVKVRLSCCRPVRTARQVNFLGEPLADCRLEDGRIAVRLEASEWTEIEARWT